MHGQGQISYPTGHILEGEFREGKFYTGTGSVRFKDGSVYEGALLAGEKHGQGKLTYLEGNIVEGEFRKGNIWNGSRLENGQIAKRWVEGKLVVTEAEESAPTTEFQPDTALPFTNKQGVVFDGVYLDASNKHGKGQIKYPDGSVYEGEWLKDKRHGAGRLTSATGEVFEGMFEKDVPVSGKGVLLIKNGGKYEGELVEGKRHGLAKITNKEGVMEEVEFLLGKKVIKPTPLVATSDQPGQGGLEDAVPTSQI
eukprot:gene39274-biopygen29809